MQRPVKGNFILRGDIRECQSSRVGERGNWYNMFSTKSLEEGQDITMCHQEKILKSNIYFDLFSPWLSPLTQFIG